MFTVGEPLQSANQLPEKKSMDKQDNYLVIGRKSNRGTRPRKERQIHDESK